MVLRVFTVCVKGFEFATQFSNEFSVLELGVDWIGVLRERHHIGPDLEARIELKRHFAIFLALFFFIS